MADDLRGYMVSGSRPEEGAVLAFATTARGARNLAWRHIVHEYGIRTNMLYVRVRWLRDCEPAAWGVTEPCVIEPPACVSCELWDAVPLDGDGLCRACAAEEWRSSRMSDDDMVVWFWPPNAAVPPEGRQ